MSLDAVTLAALRQLLVDAAPGATLSTDAQDLAHYGRDYTRVHSPAPSAVVWPRSTAHVATVLAWANTNGIEVVPSGGRTGLAGGAIATAGELVLSLEKMQAMREVDVIGRTVVVESGAITADVHAHAESSGLFWPVDFASKGQSQIGGNLSTNAGGVRVVRYGSVRRWVLGLEVVLMDGRILRIGDALEKDNTGLDLKHLFLGSEGTLGVICGATLKLTERPRAPAVLFLALPSLEAAGPLFQNAREAPFVLNAFEVLTDPCLDAVLAHRELVRPVDGHAEAYVLIEFEPGRGAPGVDANDVLTDWLGAQMQANLVVDGTVAGPGAKADALWQVREGISESLAARGRVHKNDVSVPIRDVVEFIRQLTGVYERTAPELEVYLFGHMGDGNLHLNLVAPAGVVDDEAFFAATKRADAEVYPLIQKFGGSISAEHGVGLLKVHALGFSRSEDEVDVMREVKRALDPNALLNPRKVLPDEQLRE